MTTYHTIPVQYTVERWLILFDWGNLTICFALLFDSTSTSTHVRYVQYCCFVPTYMNFTSAVPQSTSPFYLYKTASTWWFWSNWWAISEKQQFMDSGMYSSVASVLAIFPFFLLFFVLVLVHNFLQVYCRRWHLFGAPVLALGHQWILYICWNPTGIKSQRCTWEPHINFHHPRSNSGQKY